MTNSNWQKSHCMSEQEANEVRNKRKFQVTEDKIKLGRVRRTLEDMELAREYGISVEELH